jgi:aryl-alcohol dehydrogenase-like predicted oxidoreductase
MVELALGTVQFGLAYGIAGRGHPVPAEEAAVILRRAATLGIRRLDTASGYGDIEERLTALVGDEDLEIVTKVPSLAGVADPGAVRRRVADSIAASHARLGPRLRGILFHESRDLLGPHADHAWAQAVESAGGLPLGPSCYDVATLAMIAGRLPVAMAQVPGNAFDQAIGRAAGLAGIEITVRSAFLQGLLLMPERAAAARIPAAAAALERWHAFLGEYGFAPLVGALSVVKGFANVDYCVVGVDTLAQLDGIAQAWDEARPLSIASLDTMDGEVIDPRRWPQS